MKVWHSRIVLGCMVILTMLVIALLIDDQVVSRQPVDIVVVEAPHQPSTTTSSTTTTVPSTTTTTIGTNISAFFDCIRWRESRGDYGVVDPTGTFMGAYQFYQGGWDSIAAKVGRTDLVGVKPNHASPADQDTIAYAAYRMLGSAPWGGACD